MKNLIFPHFSVNTIKKKKEAVERIMIKKTKFGSNPFAAFILNDGKGKSGEAPKKDESHEEKPKEGDGKAEDKANEGEGKDKSKEGDGKTEDKPNEGEGKQEDKPNEGDGNGPGQSPPKSRFTDIPLK